MTTPAQFAAKMSRLAAELPRDTEATTREAATFVKTTALAELRRVAPRQRLNAGRLNVRYDVRTGTNPVALVKAVGPWQLIENDTRPHRIVSRYSGGTRSRRAQTGVFGPIRPGSIRGGRRAVVLTPYGYRRYARHPGTRGKHPWQKAMNRATPRIPDTYQRVLRRRLTRTFGL